MKTAVHITLNSFCTDKDIRRNTDSNTGSSTTIPTRPTQKKPANFNRNSVGFTVVSLGPSSTIPECVIPLSVNADTDQRVFEGLLPLAISKAKLCNDPSAWLIDDVPHPLMPPPALEPSNTEACDGEEGSEL